MLCFFFFCYPILQTLWDLSAPADRHVICGFLPAGCPWSNFSPRTDIKKILDSLGIKASSKVNSEQNGRNIEGGCGQARLCACCCCPWLCSSWDWLPPPFPHALPPPTQGRKTKRSLKSQMMAQNLAFWLNFCSPTNKVFYVKNKKMQIEFFVGTKSQTWREEVQGSERLLHIPSCT